MPPVNAKVRVVKNGRQVQATYSDGSTQWITVINGKHAGKKYNGINYDKNGFPVFPHKFQMTLPNDVLKEKRDVHDSIANKALKKSYEKNKRDFQKKFTPKQIQDISKGNKPRGYTWHHHQKRGFMQLVATEAHEKARHTGGVAIWGTDKPKKK